MEIKVIGSGSSGNCYLVKDGKTALLIECGLTYKTINHALNYEAYNLDAALITHEHGDHSRAHKQLVKTGIPIYATKGTISALDQEESYHYRALERNKKDIIYRTESIGSFDVTAFETVHDSAEPVGFLIKSLETGERLVFITDTAYCLLNFADVKIDYWLIEINYNKEILDSNALNADLDLGRRNRVLDSHMSMETAVSLLKASRANVSKQIYVLHLSDHNSSEKTILTTLQKEFPAVDIIIC